MKKCVFKRLVYTLPDLSPRFTCKVNLSNTKNPVWFFILASLLDGGMECVNWLPQRTIVCFIKLYFGAVQYDPLSLQRSGWRNWIKSIKLRWWATGLFCLERICFPGLILCDRTWLLFLGVHIKTINSMLNCFTLGLSNYFSLKSQPLP